MDQRARSISEDPMSAELARHIITFDPDAPQDRLFSALAASPRAHLAPIPWPAGLAPQVPPATTPPAETDPLPKADVLVVTWTVAEAKALADVLTPGQPSTAWSRYGHNFQSTFVPMLRGGAPALESGCLGVYCLTQIGERRVLCMKSDLHLSQDGPKLPVRTLWRQIIEETKPELVITTGTAGAIGAETELGDVIVTKSVQFDCKKTFAKAAFAKAAFTDGVLAEPSRRHFALADEKLLPVNAVQLPSAPRGPRIVDASASDPATVLTTDFFAFDDTTDSYGLRAYDANARAVEMGDAVLGLVCAEDLHDPPPWAIVRNASDPQIDGSGSLAEQAQQAAQIYEKYGYWTTVGSAIACWALIAAAES
jgi:nucleoside phosphorylase